MYLIHIHRAVTYELPEIPPCEVVFPKQGDELQSGVPVYSVLVCHLTDEVEEQLNKLSRQFTVVVKVCVHKLLLCFFSRILVLMCVILVVFVLFFEFL